MHAALWVSKTGLTAQDKQLTTISNNLANAATTGFKRDRVVFEDLLYQVRVSLAHNLHKIRNCPQDCSWEQVLGLSVRRSSLAAVACRLQTSRWIWQLTAVAFMKFSCPMAILLIHAMVNLA